MIVQETVVYKLYDSDLRKLFDARRNDTIQRVDVRLDADNRPVLVSVTVSRPVRGRWFKTVVTGR